MARPNSPDLIDDLMIQSNRIIQSLDSLRDALEQGHRPPVGIRPDLGIVMQIIYRGSRVLVYIPYPDSLVLMDVQIRLNERGDDAESLSPECLLVTYPLP